MVEGWARSESSGGREFRGEGDFCLAGVAMGVTRGVRKYLACGEVGGLCVCVGVFVSTFYMYTCGYVCVR